MTTHAVAKFEISGWDEQPCDEGTGVAKLTEAMVGKTYNGDIEGTSTTKWLLVYAPDKTATFVGVERFKGTVLGKHGSFVLQHVGTYAEGSATADLTVLSGTNAPTSATGRVRILADPAATVGPAPPARRLCSPAPQGRAPSTAGRARRSAGRARRSISAGKR